MTPTLFDTVMMQEGLRWRQAPDPDYSPDARCAEFIKSFNGGDTELEYLGLLHWLVRCLKPERVLETGTANGLGTLAIASALECNEKGHLTTVDTAGCQKARDLLARSKLDARTSFVRGDALAFCACCDVSFEFGFFDSVIDRRYHEIRMLKMRGRLSGLAAIHDTGATRFGAGLNHELRDALFAMRNVELPFGRGLTLVHVGP